MNFIKRVYNKFRISLAFASLGVNLVSKIKLFWFSFWLSIRKWLSLSKKIEIKLKLQKFNRIFCFYLTDNLDLAILKEIFLDNEYDISLNEEPEIIFDLGGNIGLSAIYFHLRYPGAKIYVFEPDPETFKRLEKNIKQFDNIFAFNVAISDKDSREKFYVYPNQTMSSSLVQRLPNQPFIEIETKTLDSILNELSVDEIDLLKFDVEGAEFAILSNFKNLRKVKNLIGEVHFDLMKASKEEFFGIFKDFNINIKKRETIVEIKKKESGYSKIHSNIHLTTEQQIQEEQYNLPYHFFDRFSSRGIDYFSYLDKCIEIINFSQI